MRNLSAFQPNGLKQIQLADTSLFSDANLVAYWQLEDENDSKGSNNLTNTSVTFGAAKFNNGATFNAATDKLEIADNAALSITGALTISCWAKINTLPANTKYVVFGRKWTTTGNQRSYGFYLYNAAGTYTVYSEVSVNGTTATSGSYNYTPDTNWHLYTMVYAPSTSIVTYIDGVAVNTYTTSIPAAIYDSTSVFNLGSDGNGSVDAVVDDAAIFNRALSAGEIQQLYYSGSTKAYYPLNGNSNDFSGNTNTGTDTAITYPQGRFGQGAKFNGSSSVITAADSTSLDITGNLFVSAWISTTSYQSGGNAIISKDTYPDTATDRSFLFYLLEGGADTGKLSLIYFKSNSIYKQASSTTRAIKDDKIHHVAATIDVATQTITLYVDGLPVSTSTSGSGTADAIQNSTASLKLGDRNGTGHLYHAGIIDEVIIESRAWTAKEVETYYRKSVLNYRQKTFGQIVYAYISELLKGSYTLTGKNVSTFRNYVSSLLKGAYAVTGKNLTVARAYTAHLLKGAYNLVGKALRVPMVIRNRTKHTATGISNRTKHSATVKNRNKS